MKKIKSKICPKCNKTFFKKLRQGKLNWLNRKYCSQECCYKAKIKPIKFKYCLNCNKIIYKDMDWSYIDWNKRKYCSRRCFNEFIKSNWISCICLNCDKYFRIRKQQVERGRGKYCSKKCMTEDKRIYLYTPIEEIVYQFRQLEEYKEWRMNCLRRDWFRCQICGSKKKLEVHHKEAFKKLVIEFLQEYNQFSPIEDKETLVRLAIKWQSFWNIDDGKTLCEDCHKKEHSKKK